MAPGFLDPQLNCYVLKECIPLSYYEIFQSFEDISFIFLGNQISIEENDYRDFIKNYFGYICVDCVLNGIKTSVYLHLHGKRQLLTFQAMPLSNAVFTKNLDDIYFNPNNTTILFEYKEPINANKIIRDNNLTSIEEIEENFSLFCAKPDFVLRFISNTPNIDYYELQINENEPINITNNLFDWSINEGIHRIRVCSVNKQGIRGSFTKMKIQYC